MKQEYPFMSIVIPTHNRLERLADCLRSCSRFDYPHDRFELIVVDDGGVEPLDKVIEQFHGMFEIKCLRQENAGPAAARNAGAFAAAGEFLVFTDDDCAPAPNWLEVLAARFRASPDWAVGGETANALTQNLYSTASQLLISYIITYYNGAPERTRFFPSCNLAFPARRFRDIGGFDVSFPRSAGEDREMCFRWQQRGYRMIHVPEAVVYHSHHLTAKAFFRQHFHYGRAAFYYHLLRSRQLQQTMKLESLTFYVNMLAYPFRKIPFSQAMRVMPLFFVAQAVNAVGFFWECAKVKMGMTRSEYSSI